jgi:hypothetical protein
MRRRIALLVGLGVLAAPILWITQAQGASTSGSAPVTVPLTQGGSTSFDSATTSTGAVVDTTEIDQATIGDTDASDGTDIGDGVNRSLPGTTTGNGEAVNPSKKAKSNPMLGTNFQGLNLHDQRFANGGNQFTVEPPDQGLCAGNGFIVEAVNDVLRVYHTDGSPATAVVDLNSFYQYAAAIDRATGKRGPTVTDPSCIFDASVQRFFVVVLTLDHVGTTAALNGNNHLDIAVSNSSDPTAGFTILRLPVQNNGTAGTPDHHCTNGFCLGDYPHIGSDANGIYLTTNEFAVFGAGFFGSQIYAISKTGLLSGSVNAVLFDTLGAGPDGAGFTVWPASVPGTTFATQNNGTEFFLSSDAVFSSNGASSQILQWTMSNTASLNTATPSPDLTISTIPVTQYAVPPRATQPAGNRPLGQCIGDTVIMPNCNNAIAGLAPGNHNNATFGPPNGNLNSNDSRMQQVTFANGKLWGALDTAISVNGQTRAGIAFYVLNPSSGNIVLQGQAGLEQTDLTYPAIGVTDSGRGVMAFTLTGDNDFPSAAYAGVDALVGLGDVAVAAVGAGSWDGFTSYRTFGSGRPRWGDYGAAAVTGNTIWIASEYVAQTCTYDQYRADPTCGGTRAPLGNWSTHISNITP